MFRTVIIFLVLFIVVARASSQDINAKFKHLQLENGPIAGIRKIYQDTSGYIWLGTRMGLFKYDGHKIRHFTPAELSNDHFASSNSQLIFEDRKSRLWIATNTGGLMIYNRDLDRFDLVNDSTTSLRALPITQLEDSLGNFWIGTTGAGLFYFNPATREMKNYISKENDHTSLPDNHIQDVAFDMHRNLWIGSTNGLSRYNPATDDFTRFELSNSNPGDTYKYKVVRDILPSADGRLYIGSYSGLHIFDFNTFKDDHIMADSRYPDRLSNNSIFKIIEGDSNKLWIATYGGGLNRFDRVTRKFERWQAQSADPFSIASNNIFEIIIDRDKTLWVGTVDNGISLLKLTARGIHTITHRPEGTNSISKGHIRTLLSENDSILWLGLNGGGLNRLNIYTGKARRYLYDPYDKTSLSTNFVSSIDKDRNGNLWVGLDGAGFIMFEKKSGRFIRNPIRGEDMRLDVVTNVFVDKDNFLWTVSVQNGVSVMNIETGKIHHYSADSIRNATGISIALTRNIIEHKNNIWFQTPYGVVLYDKSRADFFRISGEIKMKEPVQWVDIQGYQDHVLLLNSRNEIIKLKYQAPDAITKETVYVSPAADLFHIMEASSQNELWVVSDKKIIRIDLEGKIQKEYPLDEQSVKSFDPQLLIHEGRVFFSRLESINWFNTSDIKNDTTSCRVILTDLKVFNNSVPIDNLDTARYFCINKHISRLSKLELSHRESFFSFEFTAQDYYSREKISYAYKLEGFDKDWIYIGNRKYVNYTSLDPGVYVFRVKAANADGIWNEEGVSLKVVIHPPFWLTWWFIALEILFGMTVAYLILRYKVSESVKLERLRNKIASDLHDEIGSSLTRMAIYSDRLGDDLAAPQQEKYLQNIKNLSREVVSTMSDIVWSVDNHNDSVGDLIIRMKDFATDIFQSKNIDVAFSVENVDEGKTIDPVLKQNLYLIFKESVNNIIKHAAASHVHISIVNRHDNFVMKIHDDGKGLHAQISEKGNGLRNMEKRAHTIGAFLQILNQHGTTIVVKRSKI